MAMFSSNRMSELNMNVFALALGLVVASGSGSFDAETPRLAQRCDFFAESTRAEAKEYDLCSKYIPDASQRFGYTVSGYQARFRLFRIQRVRSSIADPRLCSSVSRNAK